MGQAEAERVVAAIVAGRRFLRQKGGWAAGGVMASDALVADLVKRGRVRCEADRLVAVAPGPRALADRASPDDATGRRRVTVNLAESPLGWLCARGLLDARQHEAGERLRGDWTIAGMGARVTMRWDAGAATTGERLDPTLAQIAAKHRMEAALDAVGAGPRDILWRIACAGEGMEGAERALGWPARSGRVVLGLALDRLADFYRLA